ncbi:LuxR C-terminal-related transcriptional regulator [Streptomyces lavendulocolor]|uniref:LuxR C-terminal-related transcriptional regulator n=1 Tax=Streptomyces lavendulocolor TaxID=67316 RepID=UPI003C2C4DC1
MSGEEDGPARAVPPPVAAEAALRPLEEAMARIRREASEIRAAVAAYDSVYSEGRGRTRESLTVVHGKRAIHHALEAAAHRCATEVLVAQPGGGLPAELLQRGLALSLPLLARGVRQRTLYQHSARTHKPTLAHVEQLLEHGAEVRTLAEMSDQLIICDEDVAFLPSAEDGGHAMLIATHPDLVRYLRVMFERSWAQAAPVDPSASRRPDSPFMTDLQRTILRAVVEGETDERIARRIGLSRRTVVSHIRKVAEHFGSNSRAQLGFLLAGSGLLDDGVAPAGAPEPSPGRARRTASGGAEDGAEDRAEGGAEGDGAEDRAEDGTAPHRPASPFTSD